MQTKQDIELTINTALGILRLEASELDSVHIDYNPARRAYITTLNYPGNIARSVTLPIGMFEADTTALDIFDVLIDAHFRYLLMM